MNLIPVNGHLLIEPVAHEEFMASERNTYEEVGVVICEPRDMPELAPLVGNKVFFDSWLAAKYPKTDGKPDEFYWLVKWEDVRAIEHVEPIPEQ